MPTRKDFVSPLALQIKTIAKEVLHQDTLQSVVANAMQGVKGDYSVSIENLKTGESYDFNPEKIYESASLYKLWVMGDIFKLMEEEKVKSDDVLSEDIAGLNNEFGISSDSAELTDGTETFTVTNALTQMITISHNYAAMLLTKRAGVANLSAYIQSIGLLSSNMGSLTTEPTTTSHDTELFLEELYDGKLANKTDTQIMLGLLKGQQLNEKLPKELPAGTVIGHKTGELNTFSHDGGIVYTKKGDYIIVVLSNTSYPPDANERIAQISKAVYDYFTK